MVLRIFSGLVALALLLAPAVHASRNLGGSGILYGPGHVYRIAAFPTWIFDNESGVDQGIHAVLYPEGSNWRDAPVTIYSGVTPKEGAARDLASVMAADLQAFQEGNPGLEWTDRPALPTADGREAAVREFRGDRWGNVERVAYIDTPEVVCEVVLTARGQEPFETGLEPFRFTVESFRFVTADLEGWMKHVDQGGDPMAPPAP